MPLNPVFELSGFHTAGAEKEVDPFFLGKAPPRIDDLVLVQIGHLDRSDVVDDERALLFLVLVVEIGQVHDAPDATSQQLVVFPYILWVDIDALDSEKQEVRFVLVDSLIQLDRQLIDNGIGAILLDLRFYLLRLIWPDIVVRQDTLHLLDTGFNFLLVI